MQLFEGAKITQQILRQAINDPDFTFGLEAEFFLKDASKFMLQYMTQGLERQAAGDGEYFVKKLGDVGWHDVTHFFVPFGVSQANTRNKDYIMQDRLADYFEEVTGEDALSGNPDMMWDSLKEQVGVHVLMTAMRSYPDGRILGLPEAQEKTLRDIVYDGDTDEIQPFGKLRDVTVAMAPTDDENYFNMFSDESVTALYSLVAEDLSKKLGTTVQYVHDDSRVYDIGNYASWVITSDSSLQDDQEDAHEQGYDLIGLELVSPIMNPQEGINMMNQVLDILKDDILGLRVITTGDTGLHINLGVRNKDIDPIKILVLSGDEHMLNKFDRADHFYSKSVQGAMRDRVSTVAGGEIPKAVDAKYLIDKAQIILRAIETDERDIDRVIAVLNDIKPESKNHSINFSTLPSGYVEYRAIGNAGYEKRGDEILNAVLHMIGITYVATEPSAYRKEFLKKLYSMVQQSVADTDVSQDITLPRKFGGAGEDRPIAASVGFVGHGPRGGYGAPIEDSEPTPYDGENLITKFGFDSGSDTQ